MSIDTALSGLIYLACVLVLFAAGKLAFDALRPRFRLREELFERDNLALGLSVTGYFAGLVAVIGGVVAGPSAGILIDVVEILLYGLLGVALLNVSAIVNDRVILHRFSVHKEILVDRNAGTGAIEGANFLATGLITAGALGGEGSLLTGLAFWALGQVVLVVASLVYAAAAPFRVHDEIERDNVAVGVAFAGMLVGIGNVVRIGIGGDFLGWASHLYFAGWFIGVALLALPLVRFATDRVLVAGVSLTAEVTQEEPNVAAGVLEAFAYVSASFVLGWIL